jgi:hypothetical protein
MVRDENYTALPDADPQAVSSPGGSRLDGDSLAPEEFAQSVDDFDNVADELDAVSDSIADDVYSADRNIDLADVAASADAEPDWETAQQAWDSSETVTDSASPVFADPESIADPFVGRWNRLISSTNWEKGRIISQWRGALVDAGAAATEFSDEAWARRVGGVTASHVGRLRRVYDAFADSYQSYQGLYWTHFLVALDWDDAPLWLEGAAQSGWSVSQMRNQRWEAIGGDESSRPDASELASGDVDEDFDVSLTAASADSSGAAAPEFTQPGQGGGSTKDYGDGPNGIGSGPAIEGPDFGEEEALNRLRDDFESGPAPQPTAATDEIVSPLVQPFAGLPELPADLADAVELLKLAILRHKTTGWKEVPAEVVVDYLQAFRLLVEARGK